MKKYLPILIIANFALGQVHVATTGSDQTGDGSEANPFATIQKGIDEAADGDTVLVGAGSYISALDIQKNIVLLSNERATLLSNDYNPTLSLSPSEYFTIKGFNIYAGQGQTQFDYGLWYEIGSVYLDYHHSDGVGNRSFIFDDVVFSGHDPEKNDAIIYIENGGGSLGSVDMDIVDCTFANNGNTEILEIDEGTNISIFNSIIDKPLEEDPFLFQHDNVLEANMANVDISFSCFPTDYSESSFQEDIDIDENTIFANPLFCNPDSGDYTIAENSPTVGAGENGSNMGALGVGCGILEFINYVATTGSDETGDGSEENPYATIQKGIDLSDHGYTVSVAAGVYQENINFNGKNIAVIGDDIETTFIDGSSNNERVVTFENGEDTTAVLSGFSIMFGQGGIEVDNSSPKLEDLIIAYNHANDYGGGIKAENSQLIIRDCDIYFNQASYFGGGLYLNDVECDMTNVVIANCIADSGNAIGMRNSNLDLYYCTIYSDQENYSAIQLISYYYSNTIQIKNSILYSDNHFQALAESYYNGTASISVSYSLVNGGYDGVENIDGNPLFCLTDSTDYTLAENSPAVGAGENGSNMGALGIGCSAILPVILHVATTGSDETGDGSEENPFATIQKGIDEAADGDTVLVHNGQYIEYIIFDNSQTGKNIVLGSLFLIDQDTSHISATIVDGGNSSRVFDIKSADTTTHITGFTITNGSNGGWGGGGIRCGLGTPASPHLSNLIIRENYGYTGGGILIDYGSNPKLKNITFDANVGVLSGGAISIRGNCNVILDNIVIKNNHTEQSDYTYGGGAGIKIDNSYVTLRNCLIFNNSSQINPGLAGVPGAALNIKDNSVVAIDFSTIFGNTTNPNDQSFADREIYLKSNSELSISNTIIWDDAVHGSESSVWVANNCNLSQSYIQSGDNNINLDPLFCNRELFDFTLAENSPCIESGENGSNMGALGIGCGEILIAPVLSDIDNQQIEEDDSVTLAVSATSSMNLDMTFSVYSDTSDVIVSLDDSTLTATPSPNWNGTANILVMVTDENELSDTTDFMLTVTAVNDPPEAFSVIYPAVSDTFSTHLDNDTAIVFSWEDSYDVDSDVTYTLTIELEFFGNAYTDVHENITDTTISISSNSLDPLLNVTSQDEATFTYYVHSSDGEYMVASDIGEFVLFQAALGVNEGSSVPETFALHQNYPNPFNPVTKLRYDLPENSFVRVTVYDMLGNVVNNLVNDNQNSGYRSIQWNATNNQGQPVSAGVYLYSIEAGKFRQTKKMILLK